MSKTNQELTFPVSGMTCASCAAHIEHALDEVPGVAQASDVTLVRGELSGVVEAINLSRATFRRIRQNLFWAFFYNVAMVPLAVIGWMHPVLAEIAMATSSVTVVGNASRLRGVDIRPAYLREKGNAALPEGSARKVESAVLQHQ